MTGGGFGGCTVNLVRPDAAEAFQSAIVQQYKAKYNVQAPVFHCNPSRGASELTDMAKVPAAPSVGKH